MGHRSVARTLALLATAVFVAAACGGTTQQPTPTAAATGGGAPAPTAAAAAPAAPVLSRPVEFVISTGPGGASDIYARLWITVIDKEKALATSVLPVNKDGGGGAVAFTYLYEKKNDPHYIMVTLNTFWTTIITQKLPYKSTDFTPIALLAQDPFFLWVREDSPIKTAQDFVKAAKEREITVSGTGAKAEDEVLFRRIQGLAGTKPFKYVPQSGGGAVAAALAGNQGGVEATVNNPSEAVSLMGQKKVRPVCGFIPESPKDGTFKDLPTCKSQGLAIDDYYNVRSVVGSPGMSKAQQDFWIGVFKKVSTAKDWTDFMTKNALVPNFKSGDEFKKIVEQYETLHREIAQKNGWVQ